MRSLASLAAALVAGFTLASGGYAATAVKDEVGLGKPSAPVKMVEYASASCPHCARFNNEVFPEFKKKFIDTGIVYYEMREVLTDPVNFAAATYLPARCAGPEKYYFVIDAVFHAQAAIYESKDIGGGLRAIARSAGLTEAQWQACLNDPAGQKALQDRLERYASEAEIDGTPTFYFNGKKVKSGEMTMAELTAAVAAARAAKK